MKNTVSLCAVAAAVFLVGCANDRTDVSSGAGIRSPSKSISVVTSIPKNKKRESEVLKDYAVAEVHSPQIDSVEIVNDASRLSYQALPVTASLLQEGISLPLYSPYVVNTENYIHFNENKIKSTHSEPVSTFSVDVDTASYSNVRRMLEGEGRLPSHDAVKVEEMINYFSYDYPIPDSLDTPFSINTEIAQSPWNPDRHLLQIGLKGFEPEKLSRPAANLVFLIDVSGSMMDVNKLPLVKRSLRLLVNQMRPDDRIALTVYAGAAGLVLESTAASEKYKIMHAIDTLQAGGSTNGGAGLQLAYQVAELNKIEGGINRVIIASDGDMNVGIADHEMLKNMIEEFRESGVALTTLGFGAGNYNYALMEQLADVGNGNAAYIDSINEAQKVLVNEMQSTLLTIAKDVKVQVEFNPSVVSSYRLIGYDNRILNTEDFRNDKVDAGDIGAGHTVTAFYELTLVNSEDASIPNLRYGEIDKKAKLNDKLIKASDEIAYVNLRYKQPLEQKSREIGQPVMVSSIVDNMMAASADLRFAAAVAGFGQILRGGKYTGSWKLENVVDLARQARGKDYHGYRGEFIRLVELTRSMDLEG